jgi:hypothetical protein
MQERKTCSKESPMPKGDNGRWLHPDAEYMKDDYGSLSQGGSYEEYKCPNCGLNFRVTLPD